MSVPAVDPEEIRVELDELGVRRDSIKSDGDDLRRDTKEVMRKARGVIPLAEASRRAKLNRSTVYELYLDGEDEHAAHGGPAEGQRGQAVAG